MNETRLAEIEQWLKLCGQDQVPTTEWAHVVRELINGVRSLHARLQVVPATSPGAPLDCVAVAKMLQVAPRTIMKWFDNGLIKGVREPHTGNRLMRREDVLQFARDNNVIVE